MSVECCYMLEEQGYMLEEHSYMSMECCYMLEEQGYMPEEHSYMPEDCHYKLAMATTLKEWCTYFVRPILSLSYFKLIQTKSYAHH